MAKKPKQKSKTKRKARKKRSLRRKVLYGILALFLTPIVLSILAVLITTWVNPPAGVYMLQERARLGSIKRDWQPIERIARDVPLAVVASEDANFCVHRGIDFDALREAWHDGANRGGSTISQQVAKNVFLWHGRTYVRKGLEVWFVFWMETFWSKERILEVYLNIAEFDEGVFGVRAAGKHYFGRDASRLSTVQAGRLAAILPRPKVRSASRPSQLVRNRARRAIAGGRTIAADGRAACF